MQGKGAIPRCPGYFFSAMMTTWSKLMIVLINPVQNA